MSATDLRERFEALAAAWAEHREANRTASNPAVYLDCDAFAELVALGKPAVPLIIERYRDGSLFWGAALRRITGIEDFGRGSLGNLERTRERWLEWWDEKGERLDVTSDYPGPIRER